MESTIPKSDPGKLAGLTKIRDGASPFSSLTAYDYPVARLLDEAGIDLVLVGDSLGMVVLGHDDTTEVTIEMMLHHTMACRRGVLRAPLVADLPYRSYESASEAVKNARLLVGAGADAVKLEGGSEMLPQIRAMIADGIAVVGHIGMLPQHVKEEGGYSKKGKTEVDAARLLADARDLETAGVSAIVLESMVHSVASNITEAIRVPTIGIGAGRGCDGQILVVHDLLGSFPWFRPSFAKPRADLAAETTRAAREFIAAQRDVKT
jgi:3-methyl-2-oxobutanoate hydroxymethyltransferase